MALVLEPLSVKTSEPILQVISVKIIGDFTGTDYFANGSIGPDGQTIYLGKTLPVSNVPVVITYQPALNGNDILNTQVIRLNRRLPFQNSQVLVNYIPKGLQGDRISIFKDTSGYINFDIMASGTNFVFAPLLVGHKIPGIVSRLAIQSTVVLVKML